MVSNLVAYELWFGELVWVEEGELAISVTAPGSLAWLTIRQMDLVGSRATIFTTPGRRTFAPNNYYSGF